MKYLWLLFLGLSTACWANDDLEVILSAEQIDQKIQEVAHQLNTDYADKELTILMVMKGSLCLTADLIRYLDIPVKLQYISASSYGQNGMQAGELHINGLDQLQIEGQHLLVVDDIFDTGKTLTTVVQAVQTKNPQSLKSLVLLVKNIKRRVEYVPDYILFEIGNRFIIGYGLDYKEYYRGLPGIYAFKNDTPPIQ